MVLEKMIGPDDGVRIPPINLINVDTVHYLVVHYTTLINPGDTDERNQHPEPCSKGSAGKGGSPR